jgi:hypothetical protein
MASCNSDSSTGRAQNNTKDSTSGTNKLCFQRLEGLSNQDTTLVNFTLQGSKVTGEMTWLPHEKDSRKGTIKAEKDGDIITGIWLYMQEGTPDTLAVEFKLSEYKLLQKTFGIDKTTGRSILTDTSTFSIPFEKTDCK